MTRFEDALEFVPADVEGLSIIVNNVQRIEHNALRVTWIKHLYIDATALTYIDDFAFVNMRNISTLNIMRTQMTNISETLFSTLTLFRPASCSWSNPLLKTGKTPSNYRSSEN